MSMLHERESASHAPTIGLLALIAGFCIVAFGAYGLLEPTESTSASRGAGKILAFGVLWVLWGGRQVFFRSPAS